MVSPNSASTSMNTDVNISRMQIMWPSASAITPEAQKQAAPISPISISQRPKAASNSSQLQCTSKHPPTPSSYYYYQHPKQKKLLIPLLDLVVSSTSTITTSYITARVVVVGSRRFFTWWGGALLLIIDHPIIAPSTAP